MKVLRSNWSVSDSGTIPGAKGDQVFDPRTGLCGEYGDVEQPYTLPSTPQEPAMFSDLQEIDVNRENSWPNHHENPLSSQQDVYGSRSYVQPLRPGQGYGASAEQTVPYQMNQHGSYQPGVDPGALPPTPHYVPQPSSMLSGAQQQQYNVGTLPQYHSHQGPTGTSIISQFPPQQPDVNSNIGVFDEQGSQYQHGAYGTGQAGISYLLAQPEGHLCALTPIPIPWC